MPGQLPDELKTRLTKQFGAGTFNALLKAFSVERKPTFRVNTLKSSDEEIMEVFRNEQIQYERIKNIPHAFTVRNRTDKDLLDHPLNKDGKIYLQGISSMLPPFLLDIKAKDVILDLCAAPGSKTSEIAAMAHNDATIVATEDNEVRFQKLLNTISIQGAKVDARNEDATLLHHAMPEAFDKILADVPCSAEGRIDLNDRRSYSYWSEKNIVAHAKLQRRLLRSAVACLKPGGTLVYSTCTLAAEENEEMVGWLLSEFPEMKPSPITLPLLNIKKTAHQTVTVLPNETMEGFFVAKLTKQK
jgi:NOL1/NOP2/sun family putative RNA methylase